MTFELPELPYQKNELEPYISEETLEYHYGKHHQTYVNNLNNLINENDALKNSTLEELIQNSTGGVFNNAAQVWNHTFYWHSLSPNGGGEPGGDLGDALLAKFNSFQEFKEQFTKVAVSQFGSGWAWLIKNEQGELDIVSTGNADTPLRTGQIPLLTCDVWEHAYYIDYRNARPKYIDAFWNLVNWDFATKNFNTNK